EYVTVRIDGNPGGYVETRSQGDRSTVAAIAVRNLLHRAVGRVRHEDVPIRIQRDSLRVAEARPEGDRVAVAPVAIRNLLDRTVAGIRHEKIARGIHGHAPGAVEIARYRRLCRRDRSTTDHDGRDVGTDRAASIRYNASQGDSVGLRADCDLI